MEIRKHPPTPAAGPPTEDLSVSPHCPLCHGFGFLACPEAYVTRGIRIAVAWENGRVCTCSSGEQFRKEQLEWRREPDERPMTPEAWRERRLKV